jgi:hypothetical protein
MLQANYSINGNAQVVEHRNLGMTNSKYLDSGMSADVMYHVCTFFYFFIGSRISD